jgi:hypothetical protein
VTVCREAYVKGTCHDSIHSVACPRGTISAGWVGGWLNVSSGIALMALRVNEKFLQFMTRFMRVWYVYQTVNVWVTESL